MRTPKEQINKTLEIAQVTFVLILTTTNMLLFSFRQSSSENPRVSLPWPLPMIPFNPIQLRGMTMKKNIGLWIIVNEVVNITVSKLRVVSCKWKLMLKPLGVDIDYHLIKPLMNTTAPQLTEQKQAATYAMRITTRFAELLSQLKPSCAGCCFSSEFCSPPVPGSIAHESRFGFAYLDVFQVLYLFGIFLSGTGGASSADAVEK